MSQMQALVGGSATPIVRPAWNDAVMIKRMLDIGAQSILVPYVQNAERRSARFASCATRRPEFAALPRRRAPAAMAG